MRRLLAATMEFWMSMAIVIIIGAVISTRMDDRGTFADSELHKDVMERWGAPIRQPAPSLRYVPTGAVFNTLTPLTFDREEVTVDSTMNYRKRGLVYFSGFDFIFKGEYSAINNEKRDIDAVFVFPIDLEKNKVLLSELEFSVNGAPARAGLTDGDKLVWTGRVSSGAKLDFRVGFRGRGLDSFTYVLDPNTPVRQFHLSCHITGGANFDYPDGVVAAGETRVKGAEAWLDWRYASLESGVPIGVILPSEKSFDRLIATMVGRAWASFLLLYAGLLGLSMLERRRLQIHETALIAGAYGLFFVLLAYLAAFMNFYVAWVLALLIGGGLLAAYVHRLLPSQPGSRLWALLAATLLTPTVAVILQGYTGLIYTGELTVLVATLMYLTTHKVFRERFLQAVSPTPAAGETNHA